MNFAAILTAALILGALTSVALTVRNARGIDTYQLGEAALHPSVMIMLWGIWGIVWFALGATLDFFLPSRFAIIALSVFVGLLALTLMVTRTGGSRW